MNLQEFIDSSNFSGGVSGIVMGSAPSIGILKSLKFSGVRIGVGDMPWRAPELGPYDFWVTANTEYPLPWKKRDQKDIERANCKFLLSSASVAAKGTNIYDVAQRLRELSLSKSYIYFSQRHFFGRDCSPSGKCCHIAKEIDFGKSIQEIVNELIGESGPAYSEGSGVAIHGFALAIILKLNPIYILGVEIPRTEAEYLSFKNWKRRNESLVMKFKRRARLLFPKYFNRDSDFGGDTYPVIINDFSNLTKLANSMGIEVISLSPSSPLNHIQGIIFRNDVLPN